MSLLKQIESFSVPRVRAYSKKQFNELDQVFPIYRASRPNYSMLAPVNFLNVGRAGPVGLKLDRMA